MKNDFSLYGSNKVQEITRLIVKTNGNEGYDKLSELSEEDIQDVLLNLSIVTELDNFDKVTDIIECEASFFEESRLLMIQKNLELFTSDLDTLFLNEGVLHLVDKGSVVVKSHFNLVEENGEKEIRIISKANGFKNDEIIVGTIKFNEDGTPSPVAAMSRESYFQEMMLFNKLVKSGKLDKVPNYNRQQLASHNLMDIYTFILALNNYILHRKEYIIETTKRIVVDKPKKKKKKGGNSKKTKVVRNIKINIAKIKRESEEQEKFNLEKREMEYSTKTWTQMGHWRNFKSGKRTWIKPQTKKRKGLIDEEEKVAHVYKIK